MNSDACERRVGGMIRLRALPLCRRGKPTDVVTNERWNVHKRR
jgi:hypothetical protein